MLVKFVLSKAQFQSHDDEIMREFIALIVIS